MVKKRVSKVKKKTVKKKAVKRKPTAIQIKKAKKFLADYNAPKCFYLSNGNIVKNMKEFAAALADIPDYVFDHHVTKQRNDFYNWIREVIKDTTLAASIKSAKSKGMVAKKVKARVVQLQKMIK